jgi:multiple sugar transport system ATP-binding protein
MANVILEQVVKQFGKVEVVHGVSLCIESREFIVLVGPSGCGKSTILRMVAGLEKITSGEIRIGDRVVNDIAPKDRDIAMVFQNYALYPHMNVMENMSFGLKLKKTPLDEIKSRVQEAAEILGLEQLLLRKPFELSGGQRQRVAMGRAIVRKPAVFLFDEPLSNLDAKLRTQMRAEIKRLHHKVQSTVIYVTHDQVEAMTLADRIVVLRDGYIEQEGKPIDLFQNPVNTFVAGFIGSPPMNLVPARMVKTDMGWSLDFSGKFQVPVPDKPLLSGMLFEAGQPVIVGLRTEDLMVVAESEGPFPETWKVNGIVDVVEPLGNESHVHIRFDGASFIARCDGKKMIRIDDRVRVALNLNQMHIFDAATTLAIN